MKQIFDGEIGTTLAWNRFDSLGRPRRQAFSGDELQFEDTAP